MIKDQQYWKDYNQKRKEYLTQKKRESRTKLKMSTTTKVIKSTTEPLKVVGNSISVVDMLQVVDTNQVVDRSIQKPMSTTQPKLWSDYYNGKKPFCFGCRHKNISSTAYAFCSLAKDARDPNLPNIYFCQVYHWAIYQGQGKT